MRISEKKLLVEVDRARANVQQGRMEAMKELGVDVTQVLVAECRNPDRTIRIDNAVGNADLHLHENLAISGPCASK